MRFITDLNKVTVIMFGMVVLLTAGCSTVPVHRCLEADLCNKTYETTVLSKIPKEEISVPVQAKQYTSVGGGLLWILLDKGINKARASSAERKIAPLLKATADVDFQTQYWDQLEPLLSSSPWLKLKRLDKRTLGYDEEEVGNIKVPFLALTTYYQLSPNFQTLIVQTLAQLYLVQTSKPDYFGYMSYYSKKIGNHNEEDEKAIELWMADNAAPYRKALAEGIEQNMKMLRLDLIDSPANPGNDKGDEINLTLTSPITDASETLRGKVLDREGNRILLREAGGNLFSVDTTSQE